MTRVSTDDYVSISDLLGRYCWFVDEGMGNEWAALWTEDGTFAGVSPDPVVGREALAQISFYTYEQMGGGIRHLAGNLHADYHDGDRDTVKARLYNYVSQWGEVSGNFTMAMSELTLLRNGDSWLIKRNDTRLLAPSLAGVGEG